MRFVWMSERRPLHTAAVVLFLEPTQDYVTSILSPPLYPHFFPSLGLSYLTPGALRFSLTPVIPMPQ